MTTIIFQTHWCFLNISINIFYHEDFSFADLNFSNFITFPFPDPEFHLTAFDLPINSTLHPVQLIFFASDLLLCKICIYQKRQLNLLFSCPTVTICASGFLVKLFSASSASFLLRGASFYYLSCEFFFSLANFLLCLTRFLYFQLRSR